MHDLLVNAPDFSVKIADSPEDLRAAQSLRYQVFIQELGGSGELVDHDAKLERDEFDAFVDHLLVRENSTGTLAGVYRLLREDQAVQAGQFYSEDEYDLTSLRRSGRKLLELGRSCLHPDFRGGTALFHLWSGLAEYVAQHRIEILFGVASFHGTDLSVLANPLSMLQQNHLAPSNLRVRAKSYQPMDLVPPEKLDRRQAMIDMPALIKAYLRLGGCVGDGAFIDHKFNTTDVFLILDTEKMTARQKRLYSGGRGNR
ncbi:ornithine-acyl-ACP acyltransferase [Sedimentitalea sp. CY04]|uniref:L-ornithine N(alpha)-acyltransferase n=1 Tax=Parasedimentitalea denitrificans TaxID=2211118 RepID=A0ABX0WBY6_9RHOB|nr:GNAT family N-acyltransferase [Sedimentitalea sp. CY04]NIZ62748.1 ornithine-acyl-ACP acyltransferase [Sedimentitalea sp. CY04]